MTTTIHPSSLTKTFLRARDRGVPILGVETPDQQETIRALQKDVKGPVLTWDCVRGLNAENHAGRAWIVALTTPKKQTDPNKPAAPPFMLARTVDFTTALDAILSGAGSAQGLPDDGCVFAMNAHRVIQASESLARGPIQAIMNLRDAFKENGRTLVLTGPSLRMPTELINDVLVFAEALPDLAAVTKIVLEVFDQAGVPAPKDDELNKIIDGVIGLSAFAVEQVIALSVQKSGTNPDDIWARKVSIIEQTPGLTVYRGKQSFEQLEDVDGAAEFVRDLSSHWNPRAVVWFDELEKSIAGYRGDNTGVAQDQVGRLLTWSDGGDEEREVVGLLLLGPPGSGKSAFARAAGNLCGAPTVKFDLGRMQDSLVGASQDRMQYGLDVVDRIGQGRILMIATCNGLEALPPELRRRFKYGLYYFDLPTDRGLKALWKTYMTQYGLDLKQPIPPSSKWTGAEVRACCEIAHRTRKSLLDASRKIVSIYGSNAGLVEGLRKQAVESGFIDARTGDKYLPPSDAQPELALPVPSSLKRNIKMES